MKRVLQRSKAVSSWWTQRISERSLSSGPSPEIVLESRYGSVDIPVQNVSDYCLGKFDPAWDSLPALVCGISGKELTYKAVSDLSRRFGSQLLHEGLRPGDRLGVLVPNCPEFGPIIYGATGVGVTVVPISPLLTPPEIGRVLDLAKPKLLVSIDPLIPLLKAAQADKDQDLPLVTLTDNSSSSATPWEQYVSNDGALYNKRQSFDPKSTLAILPFSSGTTGPPKGVMLTHQNLTSTVAIFNYLPSGCAFAPLAPGEEQPVALSVIPMFHIFGLICNVVQPLTLGVKMVSVPRFEPASFINSLANHKPTHMNVVPPLVTFLALNPAITREKHLDRLVMVASGGSPLSTQIIRKLRDKVANDCEIKDGYGLTEACSLARTHKSFPEEKRGSVGRILTNTQVKVVSLESGETQGTGQPGELCIRGPQVTIGYLDNQEATDQALDSDGWFRTGDVVTYDEDGYFYIVDRIKDMIKVKGYQVSPTEVEEVVRTVPSVLDVAVIGVQDDKLGEAPRAFIVRKPGGEEEDEEKAKKDILNFLEDKLAAYKRLAGGIIFVNELPKSPTGKVLRNELRNILK